MIESFHLDTPAAKPWLSEVQLGVIIRFLWSASAAVLLIATLIAGPAASQNLTLARKARAGTVHIWGSPQMGELLKLYEQGFQQLYPNVRFENSLSSTVSAVAGIYTKRAQIGLLGREIWPTEAEAFTSVAGHPPMALQVATGSYDVPKATFALMIFVQDSNPIASLTVPQLRKIFGAASDKTRPIHTWGELGLTGVWAHRPIHLYGFRKENDKAQIFSRIVFGGQTEWSCSLIAFDSGAGDNHQDAGERIVQAIAADPNGIGISNVHYMKENVRVIPLAGNANETPVMPTRATVATRQYPLSRAVYMVIDPSDDSQSGRLAKMFLRYVLSAQGIADAAKQSDYLPLTPGIAEAQLTILNDGAQ